MSPLLCVTPRGINRRLHGGGSYRPISGLQGAAKINGRSQNGSVSIRISPQTLTSHIDEYRQSRHRKFIEWHGEQPVRRLTACRGPWPTLVRSHNDLDLECVSGVQVCAERVPKAEDGHALAVYLRVSWNKNGRQRDQQRRLRDRGVRPARCRRARLGKSSRRGRQRGEIDERRRSQDSTLVRGGAALRDGSQLDCLTPRSVVRTNKVAQREAGYGTKREDQNDRDQAPSQPRPIPKIYVRPSVTPVAHGSPIFPAAQCPGHASGDIRTALTSRHSDS